MTVRSINETDVTQQTFQNAIDMDVEELLFAEDEIGEEFWKAAAQLSSEERTEILLDYSGPLKRDFVDRVLRFIALGIDSAIRDAHGANLLHRIFSWRMNDCLQLKEILEAIESQSSNYKALWNTQTYSHGMTPLMCAVCEPLFPEICEQADKACADFFMQDTRGQKLLYHILANVDKSDSLYRIDTVCNLMKQVGVTFTNQDPRYELWETVLKRASELSHDPRNAQKFNRLLKVSFELEGKARNLSDANRLLSACQEELGIEKSRDFILEVLVFKTELSNEEKNEMCNLVIECALNLPHGRAEASLERAVDLFGRCKKADFFSPQERLLFGEGSLETFALNLLNRNSAIPKKEMWRRIEDYAEKISPPEMLDFYCNFLRAQLHLEVGDEELENYGFSTQMIDRKASYLGLSLSDFIPSLRVENDDEPPLFDAVKRGDVKSVKSLLNELPGRYLPADLEGKTPLHWAIEGENEEIIEVFLETKVRYHVSFLMQGGMTHYLFAFFSGLPHLAERLREIDGENCEEMDVVLERCLEEGKNISVIRIYQNASLSSPTFGIPHLKVLYRGCEKSAALTLLAQILQYDQTLVRDPYGKALVFALDHEDVETLQLFIDNGALEHLELGAERGLLNRAKGASLRSLIARGSKEFYENLFFDPDLPMFHELSVLTMLEERLGFSKGEARKYYHDLFRRIGSMISDAGWNRVVLQSFLRALLTLDIDKKVSLEFLEFLREVMYTPFFALKSEEDKGQILHELYYYTLTKFRPELAFEFEALLHCWKKVKRNHQMALFFNALQSMTPLDQIEAALDDSESDLAKIAYIGVARFQGGKGILVEMYQNPPSPEGRLQALRALAKLAVPLDENLKAQLLKSAESESLDLAVQSVETLWHSSKDRNDQELMGIILRLLNRPLEEEFLKRLLVLLSKMDLSDEQGISKILEISYSSEREIRIQCALTLVQIRDEKALLRCAEIVLSSDWEEWDPLFRHEERMYCGNGLRFVIPPRFQHSRSAMIRRILDQLLILKFSEIQSDINTRYRAFRKDPSRFPHLLELKTTLKNLESESLRYVPYPIIFPMGTLFRGLTDRKGKKLLQESIRDLIRHGCQKANLSMFDGYFDFGTWCKVGKIFSTYSLKCARKYSNEEYGVLIEIDSRYYNEEFMRGRGRIESEGSLNSVFYEGVPLHHISKIYLSNIYREDIEALHSDLPFEEIQWSSKLFHRLPGGELKDMRMYLRKGVFDKMEFLGNLKSVKQTITFEAIVKRTLKHVIRRECIQELYPLETFALPDEILENFNDEECSRVIDRLVDCFCVPKTVLAKLKNLNTDAMVPETMKKSRMRKIARLATLFHDDTSKLREKQPLHRATIGEIELIEALIEKTSYEDLVEKMGYAICTAKEYTILAS